ncbi:SH3 domain-containing protein [Shimia sagamensis]|uniref:SH3 domain-containing protein n=1 Tax=Shimia sagamensis TaxID=1566352 RepID=A0ABY1PJY5_9RHOB|nr:SH3 domain-containing protein [Shimia sagamensis]SMP35890.1 SH3 domain-containing protein [Shimia sagamensis]
MNKFVFLSLAFLGWVFWELSGGSDFEPKSRVLVTEDNILQPNEDASIVARAAISVPIIKVRAAPTVTQASATSERLPTAPPAVVEGVTQKGAVPVVIASLATGLDSFATPGAPLLINSVAANAAIEDSVALALETQQTRDIRRVRGSRVNMRGGPGTSHGVLMVLARDSEVEILRENGTGWVKLRDTGSGRIGWMAAKMLSTPNIAASN